MINNLLLIVGSLVQFLFSCWEESQTHSFVCASSGILNECSTIKLSILLKYKCFLMLFDSLFFYSLEREATDTKIFIITERRLNTTELE